MATAAEIRKRVRDAERQRIKTREDAAVTVANRLSAHAAAQDALAAAQTELAAAVTEALTHYGSATELAHVLDVSPRTIREHSPRKQKSPDPDPQD
ncbi:hypothetical protein [Microlunatus sp. Y2014]|uniref:hypothetical protein n=1 Tax=Microlunatus sp. Y2014 TaxID=3418488 RepID=UPI003DA71630